MVKKLLFIAVLAVLVILVVSCQGVQASRSSNTSVALGNQDQQKEPAEKAPVDPELLERVEALESKESVTVVVEQTVEQDQEQNQTQNQSVADSADDSSGVDSSMSQSQTSEGVEEDLAVEEKSQAVATLPRLDNGDYILVIKSGSQEYRQADGTYLIPIDDLLRLAGGKPILFEGEYHDTVGEHQICIFNLEGFNTCDFGESAHINQGSFWAYELVRNGRLPDDLMMVFAYDKWKNWDEQEDFNPNPIRVHLSTGDVSFEAGEEPQLTEVQADAVVENAAERCPDDFPQPYEETPLSDADAADDSVVVGAPGSYACRMLFVGKLAPGGSDTAYYWTGAKDNFFYVESGAHFFLLPVSWGESEIEAWVSENYAIAGVEYFK